MAKQKDKHKRQTSNGLVQLKGEIAENIEPDDDTRLGGNTRKILENMQIGRLRKKSSAKSSVNSHQAKQSSLMMTKKFSSVQQPTTQVNSQASTKAVTHAITGKIVTKSIQSHNSLPLTYLNNQVAPQSKAKGDGKVNTKKVF